MPGHISVHDSKTIKYTFRQIKRDKWPIIHGRPILQISNHKRLLRKRIERSVWALWSSWAVSTAGALVFKLPFFHSKLEEKGNSFGCIYSCLWRINNSTTRISYVCPKGIHHRKHHWLKRSVTVSVNCCGNTWLPPDFTAEQYLLSAHNKFWKDYTVMRGLLPR